MTFHDHFSGHASTYREARPLYPPALFDWLAREAPARALAWDAGCGNGQASVALATRFEQVVATDPSQKQLGNAVADPRIDYRNETAEHTTIADRSVDAITVASRRSSGKCNASPFRAPCSSPGVTPTAA